MAQQNSISRSTGDGENARLLGEKILLENPIHIHTPMKLPYKSSLSAACAHPLVIHGPVIIYSAAPIVIQPMCKKGVTIEVDNKLGPDFVRGWNKLPDELKVRILSFELANSRCGHHFTHYVPIDACSCHLKILLKWLRTTPEIAGLARETFYLINTFEMHPSFYSYRGAGDSEDSYNGALYFAYPPKTVNHLIRRIQMCLNLEAYGWVFLEKLAQGDYGFENLQHVSIKIDATLVQIVVNGETQARFHVDQPNGMPVEEILGAGVQFACKGELEIIRRYHDSDEESEDGSGQASEDEEERGWETLEDLVRRKVLFEQRDGSVQK